MYYNNWKISIFYCVIIYVFIYFVDVFFNGGFWVEMVIFFFDYFFDVFWIIKNDVFDFILNGSINGV